jgi:hypothetical protein
MHRPFKASKAKTKPSRSKTSESLPSLTSDYCPIDLYSGDPKRVSRALEQLWLSWLEDNGQGNSLRLFVDGKIVDPREVGRCNTEGYRSACTDILRLS